MELKNVTCIPSTKLAHLVTHKINAGLESFSKSPFTPFLGQQKKKEDVMILLGQRMGLVICFWLSGHKSCGSDIFQYIIQRQNTYSITLVDCFHLCHDKTVTFWCLLAFNCFPFIEWLIWGRFIIFSSFFLKSFCFITTIRATCIENNCLF